MRLLFFDGITSCCQDTEGKFYTAGNLAGSIIDRYKAFCDDLMLLMLGGGKPLTPEEARTKGKVIDDAHVEADTIPHLLSPTKNFFNLALRKRAADKIAAAVQRADRVIVRAPGRFYTNTALKYCRKYHKPYLIEVVDFPLEYMGYTRVGFFFAPWGEYTHKREVARAPYVLYVTEHAMQERYPTSGKALGCSDVDLDDLDEAVLSKRILRINTYKGGGIERLVIGNAAGFSKLKGQEYVIRALGELRKQGITNIEFHIAGSPTPRYMRQLTSLAKELHVEDNIKLIGSIPHDKIFDWFDHLDAFIQPSLMEGQGRSVIEAMGRALPTACSRVGGMVEFPSENLMFEAGNAVQIAEVMKKLLDPETQLREAEYSFTKAKEFTKSRLDPIRSKFYMDFINGN